MDSDRYFKNEFEDVTTFDDVLTEASSRICIKGAVRSQLQSALFQIAEDIESDADHLDKRDISVYTGTTGIALLHLHLYQLFKKEENLSLALKYVKSALKHLKGRRVTFLCGDPGPLAVAALVYDVSKHESKRDDCIEKLLAMSSSVLTSSEETCDELLYGRSGYLYALLYVNSYIPGSVPTELIQNVVASIIKSGEHSAAGKGSSPALAYTWHSKAYVGAAHGFAGILHTLLQTEYTPYKDLLKSTVDYVLGSQYCSGNFQSSVGSESDRLIHWCHGAPGCVYLMIKAYREFGDEKYMESARLASDVIWKRGLLKKGYGLCHGTAGNGFGFLAMYNLTKEKKYLYRAVQFGIWCCGYRDRSGLRTPDRPYSLFEGIAGAAYFLAELLHFETAGFPAFELPHCA